MKRMVPAFYPGTRPRPDLNPPKAVRISRRHAFHENCHEGDTSTEHVDTVSPCHPSGPMSRVNEFRTAQRHLKAMLSWPEPDPSVEPGKRKLPKALPGQWKGKHDLKRQKRCRKGCFNWNLDAIKMARSKNASIHHLQQSTGCLSKHEGLHYNRGLGWCNCLRGAPLYKSVRFRTTILSSSNCFDVTVFHLCSKLDNWKSIKSSLRVHLAETWLLGVSFCLQTTADMWHHGGPQNRMDNTLSHSFIHLSKIYSVHTWRFDS